jgi:hypothetical protein
VAELSRCLDIAAWIALGLVCAFAFLIARLFQRRSRVRTRPGVFALAAGVLVGTGVVDSLACCAPFTNPTSWLLALAGVATVVAVVRIYGIMTRAPY